MLLWRALTGDAKLLISHFRDEDLLCWGRGYLTPWLKLTSKSASFRTRMTSTMLSTNCTVSATRHCRSLRMWPGLPIGSTTPTVTLCPTGRRAWSSSGKPRSPEHLEDHIMAKTNSSRNFSDLVDAIQILARRPMSQVSSSFPSYDDEWDDSTNATEY